MIKTALLIALSITSTYVIAAPATTVVGNNPNAAPAMVAPQTGIYFNQNSKYAGTTTTVNGATSYYQDGKYQGQAPAGNTQFLNQQGQIQQISK